MDISTKYEFTATNAHDLLEKLKIRLEAMGLTTVYYADNIISGLTIGKRLHVQIGSNFLNIASSIGLHPINPTSTNWSAAGVQCLSVQCSRTFNSSLAWHANEEIYTYGTVPCVRVQNNSECWLFTTATSFTIVTNYNTIYYTAVHVNWKDGIVVVSANKNTSDSTNRAPLSEYNRLFSNTTSTSNGPRSNILIQDGTLSYGKASTFEEGGGVYSYSVIYSKMFNLVNNASIIAPTNIFYEPEGSPPVRTLLIKQALDIGIFNMKSTDPKYEFLISSKEYIVFPENFKDNSIDTSMGYAFRTA